MFSVKRRLPCDIFASNSQTALYFNGGLSTFAFNDFGAAGTCFSLGFSLTRLLKRTRCEYKNSEII